ncbi:hypothetical protein GCM10020256_16820 [Streptomyces thermocoprophilus]
MNSGIIRPTKPIAPLTATMAPVNSAVMTNSSVRRRAGRSPRLAAVCSPSISASSIRARSSRKGSASAVRTAIRVSEVQRAPPSPPISQNSTDLAAWPPLSSPIITRTLVTACPTKDTATPASSSRAAPVPRWACAAAKTTTVAAMAPANAPVDRV